jgi:hypothetical protein
MGGQFGQISAMEEGRSTAQICEVTRVKRAIWWRSEGKMSKASIYFVEALYNNNIIQASVMNMDDLEDSPHAPMYTCAYVQLQNTTTYLSYCDSTQILRPRAIALE